jgi:hypothetical protein
LAQCIIPMFEAGLALFKLLETVFQSHHDGLGVVDL